jgi:UDP-N-acetylglucosamine 2-epimerase (non-hydrolysing)
VPSTAESALPPHRAGIDSTGPGIAITSELSYLDMLGLVREATCALTDSGWLQDVCTALGTPCLTVSERTERQASLQDGTNVLVGGSLRRIFREMSEIIDSGGKSARLPELWDGHAAERIAWHLSNWLLAQRDRAFRAHLEGA